jgi:glycosyltransferase involved in cell wall biosynthesis
MANVYDPRGGFAAGLKKAAAAQQRVFQSASRVIAWSWWAANAATLEYGLRSGNSICVYPGVDLAMWRPAPKAEGGPLRLLFVGNNLWRKGGDLLLRWMRQGGHKICHLDIVSDAAPTPVEGVTFHGKIDHHRLLPLYQQAHLLVVPTRADTHSLPTIEALASGTPVLSTQVGAIPELLGEQGDGGWTVKPGSYAALQTQLDALVTDRQTLARKGESARAHAEKNFDRVANARRRLEVMAAVA